MILITRKIRPAIFEPALHNLENLMITGLIFLLFLPGCISFRKIQGLPEDRQVDSISGNYWLADYSRRGGLNYIVTFPGRYFETNDSFPLILFLHSFAERSRDLKILIRNDEGGDDRLAVKALRETQFPFITVSPLCPDHEGWPFLDRRLNLLMKDAVKKYRINTSKIYLTGISMGGMGSWSLAMDHPRWFAAVAPVSGAIIFPMTIMKPGALKDIPVWAFHDKNDPTIAIKYEQGKVDRLEKAGVNIRYTITDTGRHDIWKNIYSNSDLFKWFLENEKMKKSK
jgi:predicted peptidase